VNQLLAANTFDLLPGQTAVFNGPNNEPALFNTEEAPGILVVALASGAQAFNNTRNAQIDGFTITGADNGGGIFVNGYARFLEVSNNKIVSNYGTYGGGIRVGHPNLINPAVVAANDNQYGGYVNAQNNNVQIHHNHITQNGGGGEAGGGVSMCTGSHNYQVTGNYICGNYTMGNGAGIGHLGRSNDGLIANNSVLFNQSFNQGLGVSGGGIFVGGQASLAPAATPRPSPGTGGVTVSANLIQGNQAGAGDGGGIRAEFVNGLDVRRASNNPNTWYQLNVVNNMVVNNVAGMAGAGISLQDTVLSNISNNTIANNDSTATAGAAFAANSPNQSTAQPAGIVSRAHSQLLFNTIGSGVAALPYKLEYSNPTLLNNIVWHNRSFYWAIDNNTDPASFGLVPNVGAGQAAVYADLAVLGTSSPAHQLSPRFSLLTVLTGYGGAGNITGDPMFAAEYFNGDQGQTIQQPELTTSIATAPAFDEGGNFIDVRFGPLTPSNAIVLPGCPVVGSCLNGDYHLQAGSPALGSGTLVPLFTPLTDFDGQLRPLLAPLDIGADERN
jgi:large repetitive protein